MLNVTSLTKCLFWGFVISICTITSTATAEEPTWQEAQRHGWKVKGTTPLAKNFELIAIENDLPLYYITYNAKAAQLIDANTLQGPPLWLDANDLTIGLWDAGWVRSTHQEFQNRVTIKDSNGPADPNFFTDHATYVAGTIAASGVDPNAKGMAPEASIDSYDWYLDSLEMTERAATGRNETAKIYLSEHPYGIIAGWEFGRFRAITGDFNNDDIVNFNDWAILAAAWLSTPLLPNWNPQCDIAPAPNGDGIVNFLDLAVFLEHWLEANNVDAPYWFGVWGELEDRNFGRYDLNTTVWDELCYSHPYYLPFKAAGNDRNNTAPLNGTEFWYLHPVDPNDPNNGIWVTATYDANDANLPHNDGWDNGGYDTIPTIGTAKNIMTVGAVDDSRDITDFTAWGPTDDGRIKPDIVANGFELYSTSAVSDVNYAVYSGTSGASASAAGAAALLVQYYSDCFGEAMRASTLKALIIHTAIDLNVLTSPGPDYRYGWGLMDANQAADYIKKDFEDPNGKRIIEGILATGTSNTYTFTFDGNSPYIRATLCWTDPPGAAVVEQNDVNNVVLDNNTPVLVNDLDLRIINKSDPNIIWYPYVLDPNDPNYPVADANTGDNVLDNVEQVYIEPVPPKGDYIVKIKHKATLTNGTQRYSLIISAPIPIRHIYVDDNGFYDPMPGIPDAAVGGPDSDPNENGTPKHPFDSIQKAVNDANDNDIIIVRDGTYKQVGNRNIDTDGKAITIERDKKDLDAVCTIDCESQINPPDRDLAYRAFIFQNGETATTILDGFTIINGYAADTDWPSEPNEADIPEAYGGAIYCKNSSPWINNCIITDNLADYGGGAIFCDANSNAIISDCDISFNDCGSGIYHYYEDVNQSGGGIYCYNSSPAIINCTISYNWADGAGGGISCKNSNAFIIDCSIYENDCWADDDRILQHGGGIYCYNSSPLIYHCNIEWNDAAWSGGGIAVLGGTSIRDTSILISQRNDIFDSNNIVWIGGCTITNNACWASGGGIYSEGDDSSAIAKNCLIANNWGYWSGGVSSNDGSKMMIENCTTVGNTASWKYGPHLIGGLECYYGGALVTNSIFWSNSGTQIEGIRDINDANVVSNLFVTYSDVKMIDSNGLPDPNAIWLGKGNINSDPLFANPKRFDYHLQSKYPNGRYNPATGRFDKTDLQTSPCINAGDPHSDYSFEPAPNGSRINMGAYGNTRQASRSP